MKCCTSYIALVSHAEGMMFESQPQQIKVVIIINSGSAKRSATGIVHVTAEVAC